MNQSVESFLTRHLGVNYADVIAFDNLLLDRGNSIFKSINPEHVKDALNQARETVSFADFENANKNVLNITALWTRTLGEDLMSLINTDGGGLASLVEKFIGSQQKDPKKDLEEKSYELLGKAQDADVKRNVALLLALPSHVVPDDLRAELGL